MARDEGPLSVTLHADPLTLHSWSVLCGLSILAAQGSIKLTIDDLGYPTEEPHTLMMRVSGKSVKPTTVSVAVGDAGRGSFTQREALADLVFRRSARRGDGSIPLGMLLGVESGKEPLAGYLWALMKGAIRRRSLQGVRQTLSAIKPSRRFPHLEEYERDSSLRGSGKVLFQPKAWDPRTGSDPADRERINEYRADLIRALRADLGPRFIGGFIPDNFAREHYGDLLTTSQTGRSEYLTSIREVDIGIASIGLHRSTPFKIPEYLAAGRAVVSEPLHFEVDPAPGQALNTFSSVDDCLTQVADLLRDGPTLDQRQDAALAYWRDHVRPDRIAQRLPQRVQEAS